MSHVVTIKTEVHDHSAVSAACRRLELPPPILGTAQLFSGEAAGLIVRLTDWTYPVVIDTTTGRFATITTMAPGATRATWRFLQIYAVEKARIEARKKGHQFTEQSLADGSIKLTIRVGGGA